jgi:hypothetical protein
VNSAGSAGVGIGGLLVTGGDGGTAGENCGLQFFDLERKNPDLLLILDRSASMIRDIADEDIAAGSGIRSEWDLTVPPVVTAVQETDASINWGVKTYPDAGDACTTGSVTTTIHVPVAPMNAGNVVGEVNTTTPDGNGTPTGAAIDAGVAHLQGLASDADKYIVLATDGVPSCGPGPTESTDSARPYAVSAAAASFAAGIPVFVIGVATTKDTANESLNDVAVAGGVPSPAANPLSPQYYLAESPEELLTAFRAITGEIATCLFPLNPPPPVPENIAVEVNGRRLEQDTTRASGWDYTDAQYSAVEVFGADCEEIKISAANMVQIIFGCPDIPIP